MDMLVLWLNESMRMVPRVFNTDPVFPVVLSSVEHPEPHCCAKRCCRIAVERTGLGDWRA